ncbi:hypothetical protein D3C87_125370 [compost metagenome]
MNKKFVLFMVFCIAVLALSACKPDERAFEAMEASEAIVKKHQRATKAQALCSGLVEAAVSVERDPKAMEEYKVCRKKYDEQLRRFTQSKPFQEFNKIHPNFYVVGDGPCVFPDMLEKYQKRHNLYNQCLSAFLE